MRRRALRRRVRIVDYDTPERGQPRYAEAIALLSSLIPPGTEAWVVSHRLWPHALRRVLERRDKPARRAADGVAQRVRRWLRGLVVLVWTYNRCRFKEHGAGGLGRRDAWFVARCARWVAAQQHRSERNPYYWIARR